MKELEYNLSTLIVDNIQALESAESYHTSGANLQSVSLPAHLHSFEAFPDAVVPCFCFDPSSDENLEHETD